MHAVLGLRERGSAEVCLCVKVKALPGRSGQSMWKLLGKDLLSDTATIDYTPPR